MKPPRHIQCHRLLPLLLGFTAIQFLAKSDVRIQRYERFPHAMGVNVSGCTFYWDCSRSPLRRSDGQAAMQKSWQPPWPCAPRSLASSVDHRHRNERPAAGVTTKMKKIQQSIGERERTRAAATLLFTNNHCRSLGNPLAHPFPGPGRHRRITGTTTIALRRA